MGNYKIILFDVDDTLLDFKTSEINVLKKTFDEFADNSKLNKAVQKSLSDIERIVIFLYFKNGYKTNEIARLLDMREQSISRIKKRALDKIKIFMEIGN